jgi:xanthine dehydrogenase FAD-binding subunit
VRFLQPNNRRELAQCLGRKKETNGFLVAGCTDFLAKRNGQAWEADLLISLLHVPELYRMERQNNVLYIGAACTHETINKNPMVRACFPALAAACGDVGSQQIRNRGTVGGSIANASPAGDIFPVFLALDAQVVLMDSSGEERRVPVGMFVLGKGRTSLAEDEAILGFELPLPSAENLNAFVKLGDRARVTIAKINLAISADLRGNTLWDVRLVLGAVGPKAFISSSAEALEGKELSLKLVDPLSRRLSAEIERSIPNRASMPYKKQAVWGVSEDLLSALVEQAGYRNQPESEPDARIK